MKTKAAVAWKSGAPLTIETVDLEGPKTGEVLVEITATGICHTDYYTLSGAEIRTRPSLLVMCRNWEGSAFGAARGRTDVPKIVDGYMEGKINIDDLITHTMPLDDINKSFDLMKRGESIQSVVIY